ncbi:MAG: hypothetical protein WA924_08915 [Burkholderiaceae bacterium]
MGKPVENMVQQMLANTTFDQLSLIRNTFLAGAALTTAILVALTQVGAKETSLALAVIGCSIATPIWLCLAVVIELYLHIGERSFPHLRSWRVSKLYQLLQLLASLSLFLALSGVIYFLWPWALAVFYIASFFALFVSFRAYVKLALWWQANGTSK